VSAEALRRWLNKAEENLKVAETSYRNSFYAASCFHAQQAAELALKALIISRKGYQPFTHSLVELTMELYETPPHNFPTLNELRWLQEHYLQSRYPNSRISDYSKEEAEKAIDIGRRVLDAVKREFKTESL